MQYLGLVERKQRVRTEDRVVREALQRLELEASSEVANLAGLVREREGQDKRDEGDGASRKKAMDICRRAAAVLAVVLTSVPQPQTRMPFRPSSVPAATTSSIITQGIPYTTQTLMRSARR